MSDPVAEAAAQLATQQPAEPTLLGKAMGTIHDLEAKVEHLIHPDTPGNEPAVAAESATAPAIGEVPNDVTTPPDGAAIAASTGNVLLNAAPVVDAPVIDVPAAVAPVAEVAAPLPRESHLMLLEHKLAAMHAKFKTGERIALDEFEQILGHIRAVL